ncbi:MAG: hypothetical protein CMJ34_05525 [Phycisphaerae bacterium]|nr:hypothetical protein [Phycisphaerae bacterium]
MTRYWLYTAQQETTGPFTVDELREKIGAGLLDSDTQVCLEGTETWMRAGDVKEIEAVLSLRTAPESPEVGIVGDASPKTHPPTAVAPEDQIPTLRFFEGFKQSVRNYGRFRGRSRRSELWWGLLGSTLLGIPAMILFVIATALASRVSDEAAVATVLILYLLMIGAWGIPWWMALCVRRLHDIGKSGWWLVLMTVISILPFVGIIGTVFLVVWYCTDSEKGENRWGPNPKIAVDPSHAGSSPA